MKRYRLGFTFRRAARGGSLLVLLGIAAGCSLGSGPDDKPTSARIRVEGTSPNALKLITSTQFYEQFNTGTQEYIPVLLKSDTVEIQLPYDATMSTGAQFSIYVELLQPEVATATVRMRVDLDNGEGYNQNATLADRAALIYYYIYDELVF